MSKLTDALNEQRVINDHDILARGELGIRYYPDASRATLSSVWGVWKKGFNFKDAPWYANGMKLFVCFNVADRKEKFHKAVAWAHAKFPDVVFVRSPFGPRAYVQKESIERLCEQFNLRGLKKLLNEGDV